MRFDRFVAGEGDDGGLLWRTDRPSSRGRRSQARHRYDFGKRVNLPGGLPIVVDGHLVGAIGVGSGAGHEDLEVANAGLAALPGTQRFDL